MKGLITILILIFIGWCFGSTYWYVCKIKGLCEDNRVEGPTTKTPEQGNLLFSKSLDEPETNDATLELIDSLRKTSRDTLVVIGRYFSDETEGTELGLKRATNVLSFLRSEGYDGPAKFEASLSQRAIANNKYRAVNFESIVNPVSEIQEESEEKDDSGFTFTSSDTKIVINFPVASADPHGDTRLINQLKEFASKAKKADSKIVISGHTDNTGTHAANVHYGQLRADVIAKMLIEYGMDRNKIDAISRAESNPIATNDTEEGRKKNRRVEIEITPNQN